MIRAARPEDHSTFLRFFAELGLEEAAPDREGWARLAPDAFFLEEAGQVIGYGLCRAYGPLGHVVHCVSDPAWRRRGVGRRLMQVMRERLRVAGCQDWYLNVKPDNQPALALYESLGLQPHHRSVQLQLEWTALTDLPAETLEPFQGPDAELEDALHLIAGKLANLRQRDYQVLALARQGRAVAVAAFDPGLPGAHPFRVREPRQARTLLEAMQVHARHSFVRVVVDNPLLEDLLRSVGARVTLEVLQMRGPLG